MFKTTEKHFKLFKKYCLEFIKEMELSDWDIMFDWKNLDPDIDGASCYAHPNKHATITLDTEIDDAYMQKGVPFEEQLYQYARHEVIHLITSEMDHLNYSRFVDKSTLYSANERLVHKIEFLYQLKSKK